MFNEVKSTRHGIRFVHYYRLGKPVAYRAGKVFVIGTLVRKLPDPERVELFNLAAAQTGIPAQKWQEAYESLPRSKFAQMVGSEGEVRIEWN